MTRDQQVSAQAVLRAVLRLRRQGSGRAMAELEQVEPDLASYVMEELSLVHRDLLALAGPPKRTTRLQKRVELLAMTCVTALREAHLELWEGVWGTPGRPGGAPSDADRNPPEALPPTPPPPETPSNVGPSDGAPSPDPPPGQP
jgi:hypothetical protein